MKYLITIVALVASGVANAETIATMPNSSGGGGRIELSDNPVPVEVSQLAGCNGNAYVAKTWANGIDDMYGCWKVSGDTITVRWDNGKRTYPISSFRFVGGKK